MNALVIELKKLKRPGTVQKISISLLLIAPFLYFYFCQNEFLKSNAELLLLDQQEIQLDILLYATDMFPLFLIPILLIFFLLIGRLYTNEYSHHMYQLLHPSPYGWHQAVRSKCMLSFILIFGYGFYFIFVMWMLSMLYYGIPNLQVEYRNQYGLYTRTDLTTASLLYEFIYVNLICSMFFGIVFPACIMLLLSVIFQSYLLSYLISSLMILINSFLALAPDYVSFAPSLLQTDDLHKALPNIYIIYLLLSVLCIGVSSIIFKRQNLL